MWFFGSETWVGRAEVYLCPVLRGMVGPRFSSAVGEDSLLASVASSLLELPTPFSAPGFLALLSRCPAFPSLFLVRSFLLHRVWERCANRCHDTSFGSRLIGVCKRVKVILEVDDFKLSLSVEGARVHHVE